MTVCIPTATVTRSWSKWRGARSTRRWQTAPRSQVRKCRPGRRPRRPRNPLASAEGGKSMRFEQIEVGMVFEGGRHAVTEKEIIDFASLYDPQWFHTDPERARASRWKGLISSGWMTCSIAMKLAVQSVLADSESIGSPGVEQLKWPHPVRPGDVVALRLEVLESRVSRSGAVGIVKWRWLLTNQEGVTVLDLVATSLFQVKSSP